VPALRGAELRPGLSVPDDARGLPGHNLPVLLVAPGDASAETPAVRLRTGSGGAGPGGSGLAAVPRSAVGLRSRQWHLGRFRGT